MRFLGKKRPRIRGVVDVGSDTIKAILFERSLDGGLPRIIEKFVWELPAAISGMRLAQKIRENVFAMVRRMERVPEEILIALGPTVAEYATRTWRIAPEGDGPSRLAGRASPQGGPPTEGRRASPFEDGRILTRADIQRYWRRLTLENSDLRRAMIAAPIGLAVNGYPLIRGENWFSEEILPFSQVREIRFRTLALYMTVENGAMFAEIKSSLGGMPVDFLPLVVAENEAIARALGVREALVVDVGGEET